MKLTRVQLTIGRMMVVVAMTAIIAGGYVAFASFFPPDTFFVDAYLEIGEITFDRTSPIFWLILSLVTVALMAFLAGLIWLLVKATRRRTIR